MLPLPPEFSWSPRREWSLTPLGAEAEPPVLRGGEGEGRGGQYQQFMIGCSQAAVLIPGRSRCFRFHLPLASPPLEGPPDSTLPSQVSVVLLHHSSDTTGLPSPSSHTTTGLLRPTKISVLIIHLHVHVDTCNTCSKTCTCTVLEHVHVQF